MKIKETYGQNKIYLWEEIGEDRDDILREVEEYTGNPNLPVYRTPRPRPRKQPDC